MISMGYTVFHRYGEGLKRHCILQPEGAESVESIKGWGSMSKSAMTMREMAGVDGSPAPTAEEIRQQLRDILASPTFHGSKRCHQFLEYVCEQSLGGGMGALKERTIAITVFGRPAESDLGEDTIVRVGAREVRKRLAQYYMTSEGAAAKIRIDLPSGAYAPEFHYVTSLHPEEAAAPVVLRSEEHTSELQ